MKQKLMAWTVGALRRRGGRIGLCCASGLLTFLAGLAAPPIVTIGVIAVSAPAVASTSSAAVGSIAGTYSASADGSASYSVPITIPPGTAGLEPKLSIVYDSQSGNSYVGAGFSLGGLSAITRCPATIDQDGAVHGVDFSAGDRFCLDGQRLVPLTGTYGAVGAEYRTEIDQFSRILSYGGTAGNPQYFQVWTKSGLIIQYGNTPDSRVGSNGQTAITWAENRVADTVGNYYTVTYSQNQTTGEYYPTDFYYTANDAAGISATSANHVKLSYQTRPDVVQFYLGGSLFTESMLLQTIASYSPGSSAPMRTYTLGYDASGLLGRSRLTSITECGSDGTCLNPTTFNRSATETVQQWSQGYWNVSVPGAPLSNLCFRGDLNGDGLTDIWCETGSGTGQWTVTFGALGLPSYQTTWTGPAVSTPVSDHCFTGDLNGDGLADMWCETASGSGQWSVAFSTGYNWVANGQLNSIGPSPQWPIGDQCFIGDQNGDGRTDMWCETGSATGLWTVATSNAVAAGTNIWSFGNAIGPQAQTPVGNQCFTGDLNGDGRTDMWCWTQSSNANGLWSVAIADGTGWDGGFWQGPVPSLPVSSQCLTGDLNGDGLTDMWCETGSGSGQWIVSLSTGTGWTGNAQVKWINGPAPSFPVGNQCITGDINGDGYADTFCETGQATGIWDIGLSNGQGWTRQSFNGPSPNLPVGNQCFDSDINGDGLIDLLCTPNSGSGLSVALSNTLIPGVVTSITNGLGAQILISYKRLTDSTVYTQLTGSTYPVREVRDARVVVSAQQSSDGIGGLRTTTYTYTGARDELAGRGFLGFATVTTNDQTRGTAQLAQYSQTFPYVGTATDVKTSVTSGASAGEMLSEDVTTPQTPPLTWSGGGTRYFASVAQTIHRDYEINGGNPVVKSTVAGYTYGEPQSAFYGNLTNSTQSVYPGLETSGNTPFTTTTSSSFNNDTTNWFLGRMSGTTVQRTAPNEPAISRTSSFNYDPSTGLLKEEIVEPSVPTLEVDTVYGHDVFGNVNSTTVSGPSFTTRQSGSTFDPSSPNLGRFKTQDCNALGQCTNGTFDPGTGNVLTATDANGLVTSYGYDGYGRSAGSTFNNRGVVTTSLISRFWCSNNSSLCGNSGLYGVLTSLNTGQQSLSVRDTLEREIQKAALNGGGSWVQSLTQYDTLGRAAQVSSPQFQNASTTFWTKSTFDVLDRAYQVNAPIDQSHGSGRITQYNFQGLTTTITDPKGNNTTQTVNVMGKPVSVQDGAGSTISYSYDSYDNLLSTQDSLKKVISSVYDAVGKFRTSLSDPTMGSWTYNSDALGELLSQTDAKGQQITFTYDVLGRNLTRVAPDYSYAWTWDIQKNCASGSCSTWYGALWDASKTLRSNSTQIFDHAYTYTAVGSINSETETTGNGTFTTSYSYDGFGRSNGTTYPSGLGISVGYSAYGAESSISQNCSGCTVFWTGNAWDQWGKVSSETLGNGIANSMTRDNAVGLLKQIVTGPSSAPITQLGYAWDLNQNLGQRVNQSNNQTETFNNDGANRLLGDTVSNPVAPTATSSYTYDATGNTQVGNGSPGYLHGSRAMTWSAENQLTQITDSFLGQANFDYGADGELVDQIAGNAGTTSTTTLYLAGGRTEEVLSAADTSWKTYIPTPTGTVAMVVQSGTQADQADYLTLDHQGSVVAVTDGTGNLIQQYAYSPYGHRYTTYTASGYNGMLSDYGFTGQLQLDQLNLVHMKGRVYDPETTRFLSADPFIQSPTDPQSYNRYAYVVDNPLTQTDPTGYFHWGSFVHFLEHTLPPDVQEAYTLAQHSHVIRQIFTVGGDIASSFCGPYVGACVAGNTAVWDSAGGVQGWALARQAGLAGAEAEADWGIGQYVPSYGANVVAHGLLSGTTTVLRGGSFESGFLSGSMSAGFAGMYSRNIFIGTAEAAVVGGTVSVIGGGKFSNGAITAAFSHLFNYCLHGKCDTGFEQGMYNFWPGYALQTEYQNWLAGKGFDFPHAFLGALAMVGGPEEQGVGAATNAISEGTVPLFRAMGEDEASRFADEGYTAAESRAGKYFGFNLDGPESVMNFATHPWNANLGTVTLTRVDVPESFLLNGTRFFDPGGAGASIHFADEFLPQLNQFGPRVIGQ